MALSGLSETSARVSALGGQSGHRLLRRPVHLRRFRPKPDIGRIEILQRSSLLPYRGVCYLPVGKHGSHMKRREFISLLGGAVAAWPLAARAQQPERMRRVGALMPSSANDPQVQARYAAFLQGLQQLGWTVGNNVQIDSRWSLGNEDDTRKYATELVALAPDVIFASGSATVGPLQRATRTVPIVFVATPDPVGAGFVESLALYE